MNLFINKYLCYKNIFVEREHLWNIGAGKLMANKCCKILFKELHLRTIEMASMEKWY